MSEKRQTLSLIRQGGVKYIAKWPQLLLMLVFLSYLSHRIGIRGLGFFAGPALFYRLFSGILSHSQFEVIKRKSAFYRNRDAFESAQKSYHGYVVFFAALTGITCALLFVFADRISLFFFKTILCSLSIRLFALCLVFDTLRKCMDGFIDGMAIPMPGVISAVSGYIVSIVAAFFLSGPFSGYAEKVAALMRTDDYYYAYMASMGAACVLAGCALSAVVMFVLKAGMMKHLHRVYDGGVRLRSRGKGLLSEVVPVYFTEAVRVSFSPALLLSALLLCFKKINISFDEAGIYMAVCCIAFFPVELAGAQLSAVTARHMDREKKRQDYPAMRERLALGLKVMTYLTFPFLTAVFSMAPAVGSALIDTDAESFTAIMRFGVWCSLLAGLSVFLCNVISVIRSRMSSSLMYIGGFLLSAGAGILLGAKESSLQTQLFAGMLIGLLAMFLIQGFCIFKWLKFHEDLLRIFVLTAVSTVVMGLIAFVMQRFLMDTMGGWGVLAMGTFFGVFGYVTCIVMTHTFDMQEWSFVPAKGLPLFIARWLKLY